MFPPRNIIGLIKTIFRVYTQNYIYSCGCCYHKLTLQLFDGSLTTLLYLLSSFNALWDSSNSATNLSLSVSFLDSLKPIQQRKDGKKVSVRNDENWIEKITENCSRRWPKGWHWSPQALQIRSQIVCITFSNLFNDWSSFNCRILSSSSQQRFI